MKVSPKDFDNLVSALAPIDTVESRDRFRAAVASGQIKIISDMDERYRWNLYHFVWDAGFRFEKSYADAHIDTALRRVIDPLGKS